MQDDRTYRPRTPGSRQGTPDEQKWCANKCSTLLEHQRPMNDPDRPWKGTRDETQDQSIIPRKEVIQPHLPIRLPCYDLVPLTPHTLDGSLPKVGPPASGADNSGDLTGGVYKARERIHPGVLIRDY